MCYPGHIWDPPAQQDQPLGQVALKLEQTLDLWTCNGLEAGIVSGGSTPTAYQSHVVSQLTEIRPGTYVYNDMNTVRGGYCTIDDCAARVVCTVISNAVKGQIVLDAGSKTLSTDLCVPARESGHGYVIELPGAKIVKLSEEHAQVDVSCCDGAPRNGDRVTVIPNHICPCVNLRDHLWWHEEGEELTHLVVDARGKVA
jgi:D-serine deaminase-like pyridoxal phosphate-dependent protein